MAQARVPWNEVQEVMVVMQEYYSIMVSHQDHVNRKHMPADIAELLFANPIKMIHTACTKALKASNIPTDDQMEAQKKIEKVLESIVKVQNEIVNKGESSRIEILLS